MMRFVLNRPSGKPFIPIVVPDVTLRVCGVSYPTQIAEAGGWLFCRLVFDCWASLVHLSSSYLYISCALVGSSRFTGWAHSSSSCSKSGSRKIPLLLGGDHTQDTVDGRNPAPQGLYTSQVVQDFFHQRYVWIFGGCIFQRISSRGHLINPDSQTHPGFTCQPTKNSIATEMGGLNHLVKQNRATITFRKKVWWRKIGPKIKSVCEDIYICVCV